MEGETKTALGPTRWPKGYREVLVEFAPLLSTPTEPRRPASVFNLQPHVALREAGREDHHPHDKIKQWSEARSP